MKILQDLGLQLPKTTRSENPRLRKFYLVECACGCQFEAMADNVNSGKTTQCNVCKNATVALAQTKHGGYSKRKPTRIMVCYKNMLSRCYDTTNHAYKDYGAKGVTVCDEWLDSSNGFSLFATWATQNGYSNSLTIDKDYLCDQLGIHPKVYSPSTCQWITKEENSKYTSRLPDDEQLILVTKYTNGKTVRQLATEYSYTYQGILYILTNHNVYTPKPNSRTSKPKAD